MEALKGTEEKSAFNFNIQKDLMKDEWKLSETITITVWFSSTHHEGQIHFDHLMIDLNIVE